MPFKSRAQARFMFAKHPNIAKEFAASTPSIKSLPNKVARRRKKDPLSLLKKAFSGRN